MVNSYLHKVKKVIRNYYVIKWKLGYNDNVSPEIVNKNCIIDIRMGIMYNRIQKNANTRTCLLLSKMKKGKGYEYQSRRIKEELWSHPSEISDVDDVIGSLYKFALVRNPFYRALSGYFHQKISNVSDAKVLRERAGREPKFEDFVEYLEEGGIYSNKHWVPQSSLLLLPVDEYNDIGRVERYGKDIWKIGNQIREKNKNKLGLSEHDIEKLMNSTNEDIEKARSEGKVNRTKSSKKASRYYNKELEKRIAKLYRRDFENFGYEKRLDIGETE